MNKIHVLVVGALPWAATRAVWLRQRGWQVTECAVWPEANWPEVWRDTYDLLILEEGMWLQKAPGAVPLAYPIVLVAGERSAASFRQVRELGAQYISRGEDQDSLIRMAEEQLRRGGKLPKQGRILIVDDDPSVRTALRRRLEQEGYAVFVAANRTEALGLIATECPHIAVVDFVLEGPQKREDSVLLEPLDQSGLDLIREIMGRFGHAMRVVGLTAFTDDRIAERTVGRMAEFVHKNDQYETEIMPKVAAAYKQLGINNSLTITFDPPLSLSYLVDMMKVYRQHSDQEKQKAVIELEEILRKSFARELQVKGYYLSPGRGGSGVVLMRPTVQGIRGKNFVIKFGPRENVAIELQNYQTYVQPFITNCTHLIDIASRPIETHNLGALKFSLVGESDNSPQDFNTFYSQPHVPVEAIGDVFARVFNQTCANWYAGKRDWTDQSPGALARDYENHLNLAAPGRWGALQVALEEMADGKAYHGVSFRLETPAKLVMTHNGSTTTLPNPLHFVETHRHHFRPPRFICITHGDLNGRNMFVDQDKNVWLIDFFKTGWGPILRDFGELETVIRFELLQSANLTALYEFEKAILSPSGFDEPLSFPNRFGLPELDKALQALTMLRSLALKVYESADMYEYYVGLLYYALRMITWDGISSMDQGRYPARQRHALLSAALVAYRLQQWEAWEGAPEKRRWP